MKDDNISLRSFPADVLVASGVPIVLIALATSWLPSLRGWRWTAAFLCALLIAIVGMVYRFFAKLPLYRLRRFFTLGLADYLLPRWHCIDEAVVSASPAFYLPRCL